MQNTSTLTLRYAIQLDSLSSTRDKDQQRIPSFITSSLQRTEFVGKFVFSFSLSFAFVKDLQSIKQHYFVLLDLHNYQNLGHHITEIKDIILFPQ